MVELRDVNRGVVYVNPESVHLIHAEGKGTLIHMHGGVLIVEDSLMTVLHKLENGWTPN